MGETARVPVRRSTRRVRFFCQSACHLSRPMTGSRSVSVSTARRRESHSDCRLPAPRAVCARDASFSSTGKRFEGSTWHPFCHEGSSAGVLLAGTSRADREVPLGATVVTSAASEFVPKRNSELGRNRGPIDDDAVCREIGEQEAPGSRGARLAFALARKAGQRRRGWWSKEPVGRGLRPPLTTAAP